MHTNGCTGQMCHCSAYSLVEKMNKEAVRAESAEFQKKVADAYSGTMEQKTCERCGTIDAGYYCDPDNKKTDCQGTGTEQTAPAVASTSEEWEKEV